VISFGMVRLTQSRWQFSGRDAPGRILVDTFLTTAYIEIP
jgi:hypothetical protein